MGLCCLNLKLKLFFSFITLKNSEKNFLYKQQILGKEYFNKKKFVLEFLSFFTGCDKLKIELYDFNYEILILVFRAFLRYYSLLF